MKYLTVGELARRTQLSKVALRYYERSGLLPKATRRSSGYRVYPETIIARLGFIKNAKLVGFTLAEIQELLYLQTHANTTSQDIRQRILRKQQLIQEKIAALQKVEKALQHIVDSCDGTMPLHKCPILETLYQEEDWGQCCHSS